MKRLLFQFFKKLGQLFDFHQPHFLHLDCIDLVLENKLLLLLSWDTAHASKIRIRPGKIVYRTATSAAICKLPIGTDSVDVILNNIWRSKKVTFKIKRITVDPQTLLFLDEVFLKRLALSNSSMHPDFAFPSINLKNPELKILLTAPITAFNITINQFQLNDYDP